MTSEQAANILKGKAVLAADQDNHAELKCDHEADSVAAVAGEVAEAPARREQVRAAGEYGRPFVEIGKATNCGNLIMTEPLK